MAAMSLSVFAACPGVVAAPTLEFNGGTLAAGQRGAIYSQSIATATASEGTPIITYALGEGSTLPAGLNLSAAGAITGIPSAVTAAAHTFTIVASAPDFESVSAQFNISIGEAGLLFADASLANGQVGVTYSQSVATATGFENPAITYALAAGSSLPSGLNLSSAGIVSGIPETAGDFTFSVVASADNFVSAAAVISVTVNPGTLTFADAPLSTFAGQAFGPITLMATAPAGFSPAITYALAPSSTFCWINGHLVRSRLLS